MLSHVRVLCNRSRELLSWAVLEALDARLLQHPLTCSWRSLDGATHSRCCTNFIILERAPHELEQLGSHCSCSLSFSRLSRDAFLSFCGFLSLRISLLDLSLFCSLSLCWLSLRLSRLLFLALCASFSEGPLPSTLAQSTGFDHDCVSSLPSPQRATRLSALPQLALSARITTCKNCQQNSPCLWIRYFAWRYYWLAIFLSYT